MIGKELSIQEYIRRLHAEIDRCDLAESEGLAQWLFEAWQQQRFVFVCGNGGSACLASHMAEDLGKGTICSERLDDENQRRLKVLSLTDNVGWLTALGNDCGYEKVFVQQLVHYGQEGDLLIAISGSGNSPNVIAAVDWANRHGLRTFGMTGFSGGKLRKMAQAGIHVPLDDMGMVESVHACLLHWIVDDLYGRINGEGRYAAKTSAA
ncbi:MAG: SIS domain-containing protein [Planctomycetota bacterium]